MPADELFPPVVPAVRLLRLPIIHTFILAYHFRFACFTTLIELPRKTYNTTIAVENKECIDEAVIGFRFWRIHEGRLRPMAHMGFENDWKIGTNKAKCHKHGPATSEKCH